MNHIDVMKTDIEYLLAKIIIEVDGDNALGAAQLAEKIVNEMINRLTKSQLERLAETRSKAIEEAEKVEPVAYGNLQTKSLRWAGNIVWDVPQAVKIPEIKLYTAPQQREWIGLTDDEIEDCMDWDDYYPHAAARAVEAKLKEKNT